MQNLLYKLMVCKQLHYCHNWCMQKNNNNQCKFGFPYSQHISKNSILNNVSNRWEYYKPRYANHNVVAYHPHYYCCGVHIWTCYKLHHHFGHIIYWNIQCNVNHMVV
jgi:hypothetical protein